VCWMEDPSSGNRFDDTGLILRFWRNLNQTRFSHYINAGSTYSARKYFSTFRRITPTRAWMSFRSLKAHLCFVIPVEY
jgi:hypothetical protein